MSELKRDIVESLQTLPYAREVQAWLVDFLSAATHKRKPPTDYIRSLDRPSNFFVDSRDIEQALDFIDVIYKEQGYMAPWDLESRLIKAFNAKLPPAAMQIASAFSESEQRRDPLTNYYQKPHTPLVMGLSAFYARSQQNPVSIIEVDFSNMRGTNEHNEKVIRAAYPDVDENELREAAMELTDQYAFLVASAMLKSVEDSVANDKAPVTLIPLRTGGDEVRIVAINMSEEKARDILPSLHDAVETTTAALGLHDHPHAKRPLDNFSNGFGAAATVFTFQTDGSYDEIIARADKEIGEYKVELGRARVESNQFAALKPENFDLGTIYNKPRTASVYLDQLNDALRRLRQDLDMSEPPLPGMHTIEHIVHEKRPGHIPDKNELQGMIFESFRDSLRQNGLELTPDQEKVLKIKVLKFPQNDPSCNALIARDFPAVAGMAMQVTEDINEKTGQSAPLWTAGISFHNLSGLNETLGHGYSNLVLNHQAEIIQESLFKIGLSRNNFQVAHMGNGDFHAVIQPVIIGEDGKTRIVTQRDMQTFYADIEQRLKNLNNTSIRSFIRHYGMNAPIDLERPFATLENPRDPNMPGLRASVSFNPYKPDESIDTHHYRQGGAITRFISDHLNEAATANKQRWSREGTRNPDINPGLNFTR